MGKTKSQLRYGVGLWPDSRAPSHQPTELTIAAKRMAASALEELNKVGVTVELHQSGRARFHATRIPPPGARLMIERLGDLIESYLNALAAERGLAVGGAPMGVPVKWHGRDP